VCRGRIREGRGVVIGNRDSEWSVVWRGAKERGFVWGASKKEGGEGE